MEEVVMGKAVMGEFTPRHNSGKTAPRLIRDLLEYDAKRAWPEGKNLLTDPPPIWRDNGKLHPLRTKPNDCKHKLWRKDDRFLPPVGKIPTLNSKFLASSYCSRCFYHFDLLIDFTKRPDRGTPCRLGSDVPLHHFRYCSTKKRTEDVSKYDNFKEIHTFACSNLNCPAVLDIRITPPRLGKGFLSNICDAATVHARGLKAVANDPERLADSQPLSPGDVLIVLRTYLNDALAAKAKKRINDRNKKWLLAFGTDCDDLFEYLDFTVEVEDNQDPINPKQDRFWVLPTVEPISQADIFQRTRGHFLSDVIYELAERLSEAKPNYSRVHNVLATHDLYSVLGCLDYLTASRSVVNLEEQEAEHPHYAALGAVNDFPDELIAFAYDRQSDCDFKNKPYYLEALQGIANGRHSVELQEKAVMAISMGENTLSEIEDAYKYFNIDPESASGEEHIIGNYQSRIESSPLQKEDAKQQLRIIGQSRGSERILSVANDDTMSVPEAFELLGVTQDIPSDSISAMAIAIASDGDKNRVVKALRVIAEHRNDWELHLYANNIESGDSTGASNIAEAYRRLQIQDQSMRDESVISYYQTLCNTAAAGSKASYTDALRTIAASRNSVLLKAYATNPDAPIPIEKGTNEDPVGLDNIGNTCYLNSLLQYYYTVKPVRNVVMNFEDYRMPLNLADMQKKRVGGRAVSKGEVLKAQKFVEELRELYENLKSAPTRSVKPTQDLAELTLFSAATEANFRRQSISSPNNPRIGSLDSQVFGPELPPPTPSRPPPVPEDEDIEMVDGVEAKEQDDASSEATLVDLDVGYRMDPNMKISDLLRKVADHGDVNPGEDKGILSNNITAEPDAMEIQNDEVMTNDNDDANSTEGQPATPSTPPPTPPRSSSTLAAATNDAQTPEKPPPMPPRNKPTPISTNAANADSEDSLRAQKLHFGAQQDVTEVIGNVMFRLQCAIKPTHIDPKFGEQIDIIRETFYGANAVYLKKPAGYDVKIEDWANIIVFPASDGERSIYEALDVVFDEQEVEVGGAMTSQYASVAKLPPVFQCQIQRTAYDAEKQQASKNQNPILFEETIYLDRYMDDEKVLQRRREAWNWKNRLRKLETRQKVLESKPDGAAVTVPEALNATRDWLTMLEEREIDGIVINPSLSEALSARRAEILHELDLIKEEIATLKRKLQDQFTDMRDHRYRLQAVFIHRGTSAYGHYWIYIYDFQHDIWREYNDERVSVVTDRKRIFDQSAAAGATPYYLVYVRDQDKEELVEAVCREIVEEPEPEVQLMDLGDGAEVEHVEDVRLVPTNKVVDFDGTKGSSDLMEMGSWDSKAPVDSSSSNW